MRELTHKESNELIEYLGVTWRRCGNSLTVFIFEPQFKIESLNPACPEYKAHFKMNEAWNKVEQMYAENADLKAQIAYLEEKLHDNFVV